jgi:phosphotransferase system enzyme I (PtsP)
MPAPGPRSLLRQIREIMAGSGTPEDRLDQLVRVVASNMVAEVCSIYFRRGDDTLELMATEGLKKSAVRVMRVEPGEGLVGEAVRTGRPVNVSDAPAHQLFSYRPEAGEEPYKSYLAVPILRNGRPIGALVVQNRAARLYDEDEVEALQTVAMLLAEVAASETFTELFANEGVEIAPQGPDRIKGKVFAEGVAVGTVVLRDGPLTPVKLIADDAEAEEARLSAALGRLRADLDALIAGANEHLVGDPVEVLEAFRLIANDPGWARRLSEGVHAGLTAEAAVERVRADHRARLGAAKDAYMRERLGDLEDLANRLLRQLGGLTAGRIAIAKDTVLVARTLGPAELLEYDPKRLRGVLLEEGGEASHAAIVARALDIPCVGRLEGLRARVTAGDLVVVDGERGEAWLRPTSETIKLYRGRLAARAAVQAEFARLKNIPATTRDGKRIHVMMNAGLEVDLQHLDDAGADGIGLFRTELQFLVSDSMPRLSAQTTLYKKALDAAADRTVWFRTLDLGGDKVASYLKTEFEENPALGWRAVRMSLDRPGLMRLQARALISASAGRQLHVMFPLVATVEEFVAAKDLVMHELDWAHSRGKLLPTAIKVGVMIEAPSLMWQLDALLPLVDFLSIGANDLMQYVYAADRGHALMAGRYDPLSPPFLRLLKQIRDFAHGAGVPVSVCGEIAGRPLEAMTLIGLGYDRLSASPAKIGPIKTMVLSLDAEDVRRFVEPLLDTPFQNVRGLMESYADVAGVNIGQPVKAHKD